MRTPVIFGLILGLILLSTATAGIVRYHSLHGRLTSNDIREFMLSIYPKGGETHYSDDTKDKIFHFTRRWISTADLAPVPVPRVYMHPIDAEHPDTYDEDLHKATDAMKIEDYLIMLRNAKAQLLDENATADSTIAAWERVCAVFRNIFFMDHYFVMKGIE